jgi:hypothetical protein
MEAERGAHFDREVLDAFFQRKKEILEVHRQHGDGS